MEANCERFLIRSGLHMLFTYQLWMQNLNIQDVSQSALSSLIEGIFLRIVLQVAPQPKMISYYFQEGQLSCLIISKCLGGMNSLEWLVKIFSYNLLLDFSNDHIGKWSGEQNVRRLGLSFFLIDLTCLSPFMSFSSNMRDVSKDMVKDPSVLLSYDAFQYRLWS